MIGKGITSYKKQNFGDENSSSIGYKDLVIAHQATVGDTSIDLTNLTAPASMTANGFTNPAQADIVNAQILFYKNNVTIIRSAGGVLIPYEEYIIASSTKITINTPALANEIFTIIFVPVL